MGRGRRGFIDNLAALPWPVGLCAGGVGHLAIAHGMPLLFAHNSAVGGAFRDFNPFLPLAWVFLGLCVMAAGMSFFRARDTRRLLDTRTGLDSVAALGWRDFERWWARRSAAAATPWKKRAWVAPMAASIWCCATAAGAFWCSASSGGASACRSTWVREMYGLLAHHDADEVRIAALGGFTQDAAQFAAGKPIALIDGDALLAMIRQEQRTGGATKGLQARVEPAISAKGPKDSSAPTCPRCDSAMVQRSNRRTGETFWGCPAFPACRGTRILDTRWVALRT